MARARLVWVLASLPVTGSLVFHGAPPFLRLWMKPLQKDGRRCRSGWRESNPHYNFGKVVCGHYNTPARSLSLENRPPRRKPLELPHFPASLEVSEVRERLREGETLLVR